MTKQYFSGLISQMENQAKMQLHAFASFKIPSFKFRSPNTLYPKSLFCPKIKLCKKIQAFLTQLCIDNRKKKIKYVQKQSFVKIDFLDKNQTFRIVQLLYFSCNAFSFPTILKKRMLKTKAISRLLLNSRRKESFRSRTKESLLFLLSFITEKMMIRKMMVYCTVKTRWS